jgi:hypothetical protein
MTLRYPTEVGGAASPDYVEFVPTEYRSNSANGFQGNRGGAGAGAPGRAGAQAVILYMPNSTPGVGNSQQWGDVNFIGPVGALMKDIGIGATNTINAKGGISGIVDTFTSQLTGIYDSNKGNAGNIVRQGVLSAVAPMLGADASQLMALSKGEVYNPNVELLYKAPGMRSFNFSFNFVPKNAAEARKVNEIIRNFKIWSAPQALKSGMFEVPHVWQVKYMTGGKENPNMNKFKKAACVGVTVQANPQTTMHVAHADGMPIETVMSLNFREVDIITREDHTNVGGQGY